MKKETLLIVSAIILFGAAGGILFLEMDDDRRYGDALYRDEEFVDSMAEHAGHMMPMMVTNERDFINEMIPHHEEAVATARQVLERGATTDEIRELVTGIISAQEKEIADMKSWYEEWYGTPYVETGKYNPMMRDLSSLNGEALDKVFLTDMIMHHMGAIMMARSISSYSQHEEIKTLTKNIVDSQSKEITRMQEMLSHL